MSQETPIPYESLSQSWVFFRVPKYDLIFGVQMSIIKVVEQLDEKGIPKTNPDNSPMIKYYTNYATRVFTQKEYLEQVSINNGSES